MYCKKITLKNAQLNSSFSLNCDVLIIYLVHQEFKDRNKEFFLSNKLLWFNSAGFKTNRTKNVRIHFVFRAVISLCYSIDRFKIV